MAGYSPWGRIESDMTEHTQGLETVRQIFVCLINLRHSAKLVKCTMSVFTQACYHSEIKEEMKREMIHYN